MGMDKYIKSLIDIRTRVNLPTFGALLRSEEDGKIMFLEHLNFDDGALAEHVAQQKGCSLEEAREEIAQYISSLRSRIDTNERIELEGVGVFVKDGSSVSFMQDTNVQPVNSDDYLESETMTLVEDESVEETIEEPMKDGEIKEEPQKETISAETQPAPEKKTTVSVSYEEEGNKKKTILIVCLIVLLFLLGIVLCLFVFNKDNAVYRAFFGQEEEDVEVVEEPAPVVEEPAPVVEDTIVVEETPAVVNPIEKRYNIVVGSYKEKSVADKRVETLQTKGFENSFVAQRGDWYVAVIESHSSLVEAERRQEEIVDKYRIESWITNAGE